MGTWLGIPGRWKMVGVLFPGWAYLEDGWYGSLAGYTWMEDGWYGSLAGYTCKMFGMVPWLGKPG